MKKLKIVFSKGKKTYDINYIVADNPVADLWSNKIKHLRNSDIDPVETSGFKFNSLEVYHKKFCLEAEVEFKKVDYNLQKDLNYLHELYEKHHDRLSIKKNNKFLYTFHHAIHENENKNKTETKYYVGWGIKEGPLTINYKCNEFYAPKVEKNNLYLPWSELGKTPLIYYKNKEPAQLNRFIELAKPHMTLRPRFMICRQEETVKKFDDGFKHWFSTLSQKWLEHYELKEWKEQDEFSGVLLATPENTNIDIDTIIKEYPKFKTLSLL